MNTVTTPVRDDSPAPEELVLGPRPTRALPRWLPLVAGALGMLLIAGVAAWHFWPRPVEPLSLADLQNTYYGIVRSDGTNDASVMTRQTVSSSPLEVTPADCAPLVEMTVGNHFPEAAVDGVGTYWVGQPATVSLFTLRFPDAAAARSERDRIATALQSCAGRSITFSSGQDGPLPVSPQRVEATSTATDDEVGFILSGSDGTTATQLLPYENTLTWQYRYETGSASYSTLAADQVMYSLRVQLDAIVAARG